jgi:hypothetical protein
MYFKLKTREGGAYTKPEMFVENGGWVTRAHREQFHFVHDTQADFPAYFERFHCGRVFFGLNFLTKVDFVVRFEQIADHFAEAIRLLGVPLVRPLPVRNKTGGRDRSFLDHYPHDLLVRAQNVYGPFMLRHGYDLPIPERRPSLLSRAEYQALGRVSSPTTRRHVRRAFAGARRLSSQFR